MTILRTSNIYLVCSIDECNTSFFSESGAGLVSLKKAAKLAGWTFFKDASFEYHQCPNCSQSVREWVERQKVVL